MRRGLTAGVVLLLVLAGALFAFLRSQSSSTTVSAVFPTAIGVYVGSDVRMLGVKVGRIDSIVPQGQTVKVTMTVDSGTRVAADSTAVAIAPSVVSDRYIQLVPARRGAPTMASGATIPVGRTKTPVELDEIYAGLQKITTALGPDGANSTGSLSRLLTTAAKNLKGNGSQVNTTITEFGKAASTLDNSQADLFGTVSNLKTFNDTLAQNDAGITTVNSQLASVSGYLAQDRQDYALAVSQLSQALAQVQGFIRDNRTSLTADVNGLQATAQTLAKQKAALEKISAVLPANLQNFLDAYDPATGTLTSRGDLNELGAWSGSTGAAPSSATSSANSTLPMFLPPVTSTSGATK